MPPISNLVLEGYHIDRFMEKVVQDGNCLVWTGAKFHFGHGVFRHLRKNLKAHRVAYYNFVEPFDESLVVCHTCDNPSCVRGSHLFVGTQGDNIKDRDSKGRGGHQNGAPNPPTMRGSSNSSSKLTEKQVLEILSMSDMSGTALGKLFNVSHRTISAIRLGKIWKNLQQKKGCDSSRAD